MKLFSIKIEIGKLVFESRDKDDRGIDIVFKNIYFCTNR